MHGGRWVPAAWLRDWVDAERNVVPDLESIKCPHGRLDPAKISSEPLGLGSAASGLAHEPMHLRKAVPHMSCVPYVSYLNRSCTAVVRYLWHTGSWPRGRCTASLCWA